MRTTAVLAAALSCAFIIGTHTLKADALSPVELALESSPTLLDEIAKMQPVKMVENEKEPEKKEKNSVSHRVKKGESLITIAKNYDVSWRRIYSKNENISHPDLLKVNQKLIIPDEQEELENRSLPKPQSFDRQVAVPASNGATAQKAATSSQVTAQQAPSAGNRYSYGYCTWYVKNMRPDLPNNLGNAISWGSRAASQGIATGTLPRVGAVAQKGNHVSVVTAVHGDGTISVSEMNWIGWGKISSRTTPAAGHVFIY